MPSGSSRFTSLPLALAGLAAVAAALRFVHLFDQAPYHDEWHALRAVAMYPAGEIATRFGAGDHSIPIALGLELLSRTFEIGTAALYLPPALIGLAACALLPLTLGRAFDRRARLLFAALLAVSPILVYFSRVLRPYVLTLALCWLALVAFARWRESARLWPDGLAYALLCALTGWLLLPHLAFCLAPLAWEAVRSVRERERRRATLGLAALTGLLVALPLLPALARDLGTVAAKAGAGRWTLSTLADAGTLLLGVHRGWLAPPVAALAAVGLARWRRLEPRSFGLFGLAALAQAVALLVVRPVELHQPIVAARYALPVSGVLLLGVALGVAAVADRIAGARRALAAAIALACVALVAASGPWSRLLRSPDNFANVALLEELRSPGQLAADRREAALRAPALYRRLAAAPGGGPVVEAPYWGFVRFPYFLYQETHGREVFLGAISDLCRIGNRSSVDLPPPSGGGFAIRRLVRLSDVDSVRGTGAEWLILHRDARSELGVETLPPTLVDPERCARRLVRLYGPPRYADERIWAFRLRPAPRGQRRR